MARAAKPKPPVPLALANFGALPDDAHVRVGVVAGLFAMGVSSAWVRAKNDPHFPKPRKLGLRLTAWNVGELRAYIRAAAA